MVAGEQVTKLLIEWNNGNQAAMDLLVPLLYDEMRRLAESYLRHERAAETSSRRDHSVVGCRQARYLLAVRTGSARLAAPYTVTVTLLLPVAMPAGTTALICDGEDFVDKNAQRRSTCAGFWLRRRSSTCRRSCRAAPFVWQDGIL